MQLPPEALDWLVSAGGVIAAMAAAGAATWKFFLWLKDRGDQAKLESAAYFLGREGGAWQTDFGRQQLDRLHFKRLTGVDTSHGHESILNLHRKLGATDHDWEVLAKTQSFLRTEGRTARVRKLRQGDAVRALALYGGALISLVVAGVLVAIVLNWGTAVHWTAMSLQDFVAILIAGLYGGLAGFFCWVFWLVGGRYASAWILHRRLIAPRVKRMRMRQAARKA